MSTLAAQPADDQPAQHAGVINPPVNVAAPASMPWRQRLFDLRRRSVRVGLVVTLVMLMSLIDLVVTLTYTTTVGMNEGNPLARWVMSFNCPWLLASWKVLLMAISGVLLIATRRYRSSEIGAWACFAVMLWLMARWIAYAETAHMASEFQFGSRHQGIEFVQFDRE